MTLSLYDPVPVRPGPSSEREGGPAAFNPLPQAMRASPTGRDGGAGTVVPPPSEPPPPSVPAGARARARASPPGASHRAACEAAVAAALPGPAAAASIAPVDPCRCGRAQPRAPRRAEAHAHTHCTLAQTRTRHACQNTHAHPAAWRGAGPATPRPPPRCGPGSHRLSGRTGFVTHTRVSNRDAHARQQS